MRDHGIIGPAFWTGSTGRKMRKNKDARILATYLITSPHATAIGLYYLAVPTILHETGLTEDEFTAAMRWLSTEDVAYYDTEREWVWVPKMAYWQIGESLKANDNKRKWIPRQLAHFRGHTFHLQFLMKYGVEYGLTEEMTLIERRPEGHAKGVQGPPEAPPGPPSEGVRSGSGSGQVSGQGQENSLPPPRDPSEPSSGYGVMQMYGEERSEATQGRCLPWELPRVADGKAESFWDGLSPEARRDLRPAMKLHFAELLAGRGKAGAFENPTFGFGCFRAEFQTLRERIHGKAPPKTAPARASPRPVTVGHGRADNASNTAVGDMTGKL